MFASLLLSLIVAGQTGDALSDPTFSKPVTFSTRAEDAVKAMKALGVAAGMPLTATQGMDQDVLILRLDAVPLRDAMRKIADACGGSWTLVKGTYYLGRTTEEEKQRELFGRAADLAEYQKAVSEAKARIAADKPFDAAAARELAKQMIAYAAARKGPGAVWQADALRGFQVQMPSGRLDDAVLAKIDPKALLDAQPGRRTVFSTDPNAMERPLNSDIDIGDVVAQFVAEQKTWSAAMKSTDPSELPLYGVQPYPTLVGMLDQPILKLDVVIRRTWQRAPSITFEFVGKGGMLLDKTTRPLVPWATSLLLRSEPILPASAELAAKVGETKLTISPDELAEMRQLAAARGEKLPQKPLSAQAEEHLSEPDRYDPLSTFVSSFYLQTAEAMGKNLVADVPDGYITLGPALARTTVLTATNWLKTTEAIGKAVAPTHVDEKWIEIAGGRVAPDEQFTIRADRHLLANYFAEAKASDGGTTEEIVRYAYKSHEPTPDYMSIAKLATVGADIEFNWDALRVLGALEEEEGENAFKPHQVALSSLDSATIDLLTDIVFYQSYGVGWRSVSTPAGSISYLTELCDALPQGLPRDGYLTVGCETSDMAFPDDGPHAKPCNAQTLAWNTYAKNHSDPNWPDAPTTADKFRMGTQRTVTVDLHLGDGLDMNFSCTDWQEPTGDALPFTSLPADFVKEVEQTLAGYEKSR